jgi:hypothetical protein
METTECCSQRCTATLQPRVFSLPKGTHLSLVYAFVSLFALIFEVHMADFQQTTIFLIPFAIEQGFEPPPEAEHVVSVASP